MCLFLTTALSSLVLSIYFSNIRKEEKSLEKEAHERLVNENAVFCASASEDETSLDK